jgi:aldose 1-epimerase
VPWTGAAPFGIGPGMIGITRSTARLADGREAAIFRLEAEDGIGVTVAELGATLMRIDVPDRDGRRANVILGSDTLRDYPTAGGAGDDARYGASCGRVANRTAGAAFTIDGVRHALDRNDGGNHLHGGTDGFSRRLWRGTPIENGVELALTSPDGDQGYPGTLAVSARIALVAPDTLAITYLATTDRPTQVNIVSHPYFNLSGDPARGIADHRLTIAADAVIPIDNEALPAGAPRPVAGTPFDFRAGRPVGEVIGADDPQIRLGDGFNHCFVLDQAGAGALRQAAELHDPASGRSMVLLTDQPSLQLYSGNALAPVPAGAGPGLGFPRRAGLCLEAQAFPNAANRPDFPSTRLDPGGTYRSTIDLRFPRAG